MEDESEIYVIDSSSLIRIKEIVPPADRPNTLAKLTTIVESEHLVYPSEVVTELVENYKEKEDVIGNWAKQNKRIATRHEPYFDELKEVLAHPILSKVLDPQKVSEVEADPHILALAKHLKEQHGKSVYVVTEESRRRENKIPLSTACAVIPVYSLDLDLMLKKHNI